MSVHQTSVFKNSCLNVPLDPSSKLPSARFERKANNVSKISEAEKSKQDMAYNKYEAKSESFQDFYKSIPDYEEVGHLSNKDFYLKLKTLRKNQDILFTDYKSKVTNRGSESTESIFTENHTSANISPDIKKSIGVHDSKRNENYLLNEKCNSYETGDFSNRSKQYFSLPVSPTKQLKHKSSSDTTKMKEKDVDSKLFDELKNYTKSLESKILNKKKRKAFSANPVPIESRIPLYDKIMQDQELRRSISKLQSTIELENKMKPFDFTKKQETNLNSNRLCCSQLNLNLEDDDSHSAYFNNKQFKAKPVSKELFSEHPINKSKDNEYYKALKRRIRAEEMLKCSSLPPSMAKREVSSSNELNLNSFTKGRNNSSADTKRSKKKERKRSKSVAKDRCDFAVSEDLSSNLSSELNKNMSLRNIYGNSRNADIDIIYNKHQLDSTLNAINKSNLAALLRVEATRRKLEMSVIKQMEEERFQTEVKWRDSVLRRNPAWNTIKFNHARELSLRLQTRKDEERLRQERFRHDMELMYSRVHQQPLMFERSYPPLKIRSSSTSRLRDSKLRMKRNASPHTGSSRKVSINEQPYTISDNLDDGDADADDDDEDAEHSSEEIRESIEEF